MGKPCLLPEQYQQFETILATDVPAHLLNTPEKYALHLAAQNRNNNPPAGFAAVAAQVNERFALTEGDALTPVKLGKLVKQPDGVLLQIATDLRVYEQSQQDNSISSASQDPIKIDYTHPGIAKAMLVVAEFAAYARQDETMRAELAAVNRDVQGDTYQNPLIQAAQLPGKAATYLQEKHQQAETLLDNAFARDRQAKQQVWNTITDRLNTVGEAAVATDQKIKGALGGFFQTAQNIGQAIATRFHEDRQLLNGQETDQRTALFERLKSAARE